MTVPRVHHPADPEPQSMRTPHGELAHINEDGRFPFASWARGNAYPYQKAWLPFLERCGSAAEVFFLRPFLERAGIVVDGNKVTLGSITVALQHQVKGYKADVLVTEGSYQLAIEVDGMAFHHRSREQVAADYLRQRRIVARGYTVIRFTAPEVFKDAGECWRQVDAILAARRAA